MSLRVDFSVAAIAERAARRIVLNQPADDLPRLAAASALR
jgi:hypothetical protein